MSMTSMGLPSPAVQLMQAPRSRTRTGAAPGRWSSCTARLPDSVSGHESAPVSASPASPSTPPATATTAPAGRAASAAGVIVAGSPVADTSTALAAAASSRAATRCPSIWAWRARTGSVSTTSTAAPQAAAKRAKPLPTSP